MKSLALPEGTEGAEGTGFTGGSTRDIIAAAIEVHREFGPGLPESVYSECLRHELSARKLTVATERRVPVVHKGSRLDCRFRLDLLVDNVLVEVKAIAAVLPIHQAQLLTYLKLTGLPVGLGHQLQRRTPRRWRQARHQPQSGSEPCCRRWLAASGALRRRRLPEETGFTAGNEGTEVQRRLRSGSGSRAIGSRATHADSRDGLR
jgi:GxxExxY protein